MTGQSITRKRFFVTKKILFYGGLICLVLFLIVYIWICWNISSAVKRISARATREYPGDRVEALIAYMQSEKPSLRNRNRAIWALGQIGDGRVLYVMENLYMGEPCNHDKYLCQRELRKAIDLCKGGLNVCSWVSR
jgi:hypothetical protein